MKSLLSFVIVLSVFLMLQSCKQANKETGTTTISGKLINLSDEAIVDSTITFIVEYPFLEDIFSYSTKLKADGSFSETIPLVCPTNIRTITPWNSVYLLSVSPEKETQVEITKDKNKSVHINMIKGSFLTKEEDKELQRVNLAIQGASNFEDLEPDIEPNDFRDYKVRRMGKDLAVINESSLSDDMKRQLLNLMHVTYLAIGHFDYFEGMKAMYLDQHYQENNPAPFILNKKPDLSYYTFMNQFDLNHPSTLNTGFYSGALQLLLKDSVLTLPAIGDTPIQEWIDTVKLTLADLVGFNEGSFYDYLAANAYTKQLNGELKALSETQKENISKYFKNPSYKTLLFRESDKIEGVKEIITHPTPVVPKEELMQTIVSRYEGNVVFVDFWATWCGPCLNAMSESKSMKESLTGENITFVYIAGYSSAERVWKKQVAEVEGGEHYYLDEENWQYQLDSLGAKGVPFYLIYDKKGNLIHKFTGYPGNDKVKKMLLDLLQEE